VGGHQPSYWAPAAIEASPGNYVIVFAAVPKDTKVKRCIGLGYSTKAAGPYTPARHPLSCVGGKFGAADVMKTVNKKNSVVDATPRILTVHNAPGLYVTYKIQRTVNKHYTSTVRMVQVNTGFVDVGGQLNAAVLPGRHEDLRTGRCRRLPLTDGHSWRIFWSGRYPRQRHPFHMYVGAVSFGGGVPPGDQGLQAPQGLVALVSHRWARKRV
jgi:hypothetical protein